MGLKSVQEFDVDTTVDTNFYPMHTSAHNYGAGWQDYVKNTLGWFKRNKVASKLIGAFAPEDKAERWCKELLRLRSSYQVLRIGGLSSSSSSKSGSGYRMRNGKVKRKRTKFYI